MLPKPQPMAGRAPLAPSGRPVPSTSLPGHGYPVTSRPGVAPPTAHSQVPTAGAAKAMPSHASESVLGSMPRGITPTHLSRHLDKDSTLPVDLSLPESDIFTRLTAFESQVDFALKKTELRLRTALADPNKLKTTVPRILRFTVSNTHEAQLPQIYTDNAHLSNLGKEPSWSIRLSGRLLDTSGRVVAGTGVRKMSSFFRSIVVQLDKTEFPTQWNMAWQRGKTTDDVDTFTFTRKSKKESTANIYLHLADTHVEKYAVSPALRATLGLVLPHYTRTELIMKVWQYIREKELQDPSRRSGVICDDALKGMFDLERFEYDDLPDLVHSQLSPPEPIQISYNIRFLNDPRDSEVTFDIPVEVENPHSAQFNLNAHQTAIAELNKQIGENLDRINSKKRKRAFYLDFATDPLNFMDEWSASQIRDHALVANPAHPDAEFDHATDFFLQPLAASAVHDYAVQLPSRIPQDVYYVDDEESS